MVAPFRFGDLFRLVVDIPVRPNTLAPPATAAAPVVSEIVPGIMAIDPLTPDLPFAGLFEDGGYGGKKASQYCGKHKYKNAGTSTHTCWCDCHLSSLLFLKTGQPEQQGKNSKDKYSEPKNGPSGKQAGEGVTIKSKKQRAKEAWELKSASKDESTDDEPRPQKGKSKKVQFAKSDTDNSEEGGRKKSKKQKAEEQSKKAAPAKVRCKTTKEKRKENKMNK